MTLLSTNWFQVFYWVTVADGVKSFFDTFSDILTWLSVISFIIYIILFACSMNLSEDFSKEDEIELKKWRNHLRNFFWTSFILCMVTWAGYMLTPTKKDAMVIIAGGAVGNYITNDTVGNKILPEAGQLLRIKMKKEIEELQLPSVQSVTDTLKDKTKEELIEMYKNKK